MTVLNSTSSLAGAQSSTNDIVNTIYAPEISNPNNSIETVIPNTIQNIGIANSSMFDVLSGNNSSTIGKINFGNTDSDVSTIIDATKNGGSSFLSSITGSPYSTDILSKFSSNDSLSSAKDMLVSATGNSTTFENSIKTSIDGLTNGGGLTSASSALANVSNLSGGITSKLSDVGGALTGGLSSIMSSITNMFSGLTSFFQLSTDPFSAIGKARKMLSDVLPSTLFGGGFLGSLSTGLTNLLKGILGGGSLLDTVLRIGAMTGLYKLFADDSNTTTSISSSTNFYNNQVIDIGSGTSNAVKMQNETSGVYFKDGKFYYPDGTEVTNSDVLKYILENLPYNLKTNIKLTFPDINDVLKDVYFKDGKFYYPDGTEVTNNEVIQYIFGNLPDDTKTNIKLTFPQIYDVIPTTILNNSNKNAIELIKIDFPINVEDQHIYRNFNIAEPALLINEHIELVTPIDAFHSNIEYINILPKSIVYNKLKDNDKYIRMNITKNNQPFNASINMYAKQSTLDTLGIYSINMKGSVTHDLFNIIQTLYYESFKSKQFFYNNSFNMNELLLRDNNSSYINLNNDYYLDTIDFELPNTLVINKSSNLYFNNSTIEIKNSSIKNDTIKKLTSLGITSNYILSEELLFMKQNNMHGTITSGKLTHINSFGVDKLLKINNYIMTITTSIYNKIYTATNTYIINDRDVSILISDVYNSFIENTISILYDKYVNMNNIIFPILHKPFEMNIINMRSGLNVFDMLNNTIIEKEVYY